MNSERKGYIYILLGGCIWGSAGLFITVMNSFGANTSLITFLRVFFAFIIMTVYVLLRYGPSAFKINRKALLVCALLGIICHGLYNFVYSIAVLNIGVAAGSVMLRMAPVFTAVMSVAVFSEKITMKKGSLLALNIFGCFIAITGGDFKSFGGICLIGIICGIAAAFTHALTPIISKIGTSDTNPAVMSVYSYLAASLFVFVFMHPFSGDVTVNSGILISGFLYGMLPTSISFLLYYMGTEKIAETSKVPVLSSVETVVAAVIGVFFLNEAFGIVNITGLLIVMLSIILMSFEKSIHFSYRRSLQKYPH